MLFTFENRVLLMHYGTYAAYVIKDFPLHTRYHVTCIFTHPISKNIDQLWQ